MCECDDIVVRRVNQYDALKELIFEATRVGDHEVAGMFSGYAQSQYKDIREWFDSQRINHVS